MVSFNETTVRRRHSAFGQGHEFLEIGATLFGLGALENNALVFWARAGTRPLAWSHSVDADATNWPMRWILTTRGH